MLAENWRIYNLLTTASPSSAGLSGGEVRDDLAWLVDFEHPRITNFSLSTSSRSKATRPRAVPTSSLFVNGLPLGLIELKVPGEERATLRGAFDQLRTYAAEIPALLAYNAVCVISTGTQARMGPLAGQFEHYAPWKTIDGEAAGCLRESRRWKSSSAGCSSLPASWTLSGTSSPSPTSASGLVKRVAKYHQFHAVNKAVDRRSRRSSEETAGPVSSGTPRVRQEPGDALLRREDDARPAMANPTVVC